MNLKKVTACFVSGVLAASMLAVPTFASEAKSGDPQKFKIGFPWDTANTDPTWISIYNNVQAAVEAAGGELVNGMV